MAAAFAPNYTGPDPSCLPASSVTVRGVRFTWGTGDTVGSLARDVASELGLPEERVWLESLARDATPGTRLASRNALESAAREGFIVHADTDAVVFQRR